MGILRIFILILLMGTSSTFAAELDDYYLQKFGELPNSAKYALEEFEATAVHKCGMPLRHNLQRDWGKLEASTQKTLASYISPPQLANPKTLTSGSGNFTVHYATSGSDLPNPAAPYTLASWIQKVADTFEEVHTKEVSTMGYTQPPNRPYDVYLVQKPSDDYGSITFGMTISLNLTKQSATSFIVIDNDFVESIYQNTIPGSATVAGKALSALQITAAHEFHHAIQYGINYYFELWYAEATSSWIEDEVYDSVNQLYSYADSYLANTSTSLNSGSGYDRWIFNRSLYEQYPQLYPKDIIWKIWETFAAEPAPPSGADIPMLPFIDKVLKSQGGSLAVSFFSFAKQVYLRNWSSHQNEISYFNAVATTDVVADHVYTVLNPSLPAYSFIYHKISHKINAATPLTISYPDKPADYQIVAFKNSDKTEYEYNPSTQTITIPVFGAGETIYLLICNNSAVTPQPPTNGGGGGGGGCFIATAAYGSYLHPEVMTLRNFRDRYLLTNMPGRAFVAIYYRVSPPIADFISRYDSARFIVRLLLVPIIFAVKQCWLALLASFILALALFVRIRKTCAARSVPAH